MKYDALNRARLRGDVDLNRLVPLQWTKQEKEDACLKKERRLQETMIEIKRRFGKNAILRATSYQDGATARDRNNQIGGHKA